MTEKIQEKTKNLFQRLAEVRKKVSFIRKETIGNNLGYKAVSIDMVLAHANNAINEAGLFLHTEITDEKMTEKIIVKEWDGKKKESTQYRSDLKIKYTWYNIDNPTEFLSSTWTCSALNNDPSKSNGACLTYSEKYFILKFFNIISSENEKLDPDYYNKASEEENRLKAIDNQIKEAIECLYKLNSATDLQEFRGKFKQYETKEQGNDYYSKNYISALKIVHEKLNPKKEGDK